MNGKQQRISIHPGDQAIYALHGAAKNCDPELASDLVVSATSILVRKSKNKPIFSLNSNTYIDDLKDWIGYAEAPNPKAAQAIKQLEALVDKS